MNSLPCVSIYTDGSCWPNPGGLGGYGAVILLDGQRLEIHGRIPAPTTNNRAEMIAAIKALDTLTFPAEVNLYTDSEYLRCGATVWMSAWTRKGFKGVKNSDLWGNILACNRLHKIHWHWVRDHDKSEENNRCDVLAEKARANGDASSPSSADQFEGLLCELHESPPF